MIKTDKLTETEGRKVVNLLVLAIFTIGMGIFLIVMPKYSDDIRFVGAFRDWFSGQGVRYFTYGGNPFKAGIPWDGLVATWETLYYGDNARLSNIVATVFMLFPKWVGALICLICLLWTLRVEAEFLVIRLSRSRLTPMIVAGWVLFLPWSNQMSSLVFQFNYIIPTFLSYILLRRLFKGRPGERIWVTALVALLLGMFHEAYSLPFVAGLTASAILFRKNRSGKYVAAIVCLTAGLLWIVLAPSLTHRFTIAVDYYYLTGPLSMIKRFVKIFMWHPALWIFNVLLVAEAMRKNRGIRLRSPFIVFLFVSVWISIFLSYFTTGEPRVVWFGDMCSALGIFYIMIKDEWFGSRSGRKMTGVLNAVMSVAMTVVLTITSYCVIRSEREFRAAIDSFVQHPDKPVYNDWLASYELNPWVFLSIFDMKVYEFYWIGYPALTGEDLEGNPLKGMIHFIPEKLRNYSGDEGELLPGEGHVRKVDGYLVTEAIPEIEAAIIGVGRNVPMDFGWGMKTDTAVVISPFVSEKNGKRYWFVRIYHRVLDNLIGNVKYVGAIPGIENE